MMELNAKNPLLWDLENLVMFNTNTGEPPKTLQLVDLEIEGIEGFEVESFYSSGLGYVSSSRSSKSASDESSTNQEVRETQFSMETNDCFKEDFEREEFVKFEPTKTSPTVESSFVSGESLTALELCNRTYFKDIPGVTATNVKNTAQTSVPSNSSAKKPKYSSLSMEVPRCQVVGCNVDLSSAKDYHRKHKVCESHSKSSRVVINGRERRFCQQCSRFHGLSEFDQKKRSCRRRLSDHNARRRKPKPEVIQFNSMRLASSLHEGRNQLNFSFNQVQMHSKAVVPKSDLFTKVSPISNHFLPSKGTPLEVYQRGLPTSAAPSNMEATQNQGALSLLSTTSWGSSDPHSINPSSAHPSPAIHSGPPVSSEFWIGEQPAISGPHPPSFQLFKASNESSFHLY